MGHLKGEVDYKVAESLSELYTCEELYKSLQPLNETMDSKKDDCGNIPEVISLQRKTTNLFLLNWV